MRAIAGVDFRLAAGELRCLIGPNGAGKSTFFKMVTGQIRPTSGRDPVRGRRHHGAEAHEIGRLGIGIKNQVPDVFNGLDVRENLWLAARRGRTGAAADAPRSTRSIERLALGGIPGRLVGELAHGQRQWVEIGMVMVARAQDHAARRALGRHERRGDRPHRGADPRDQPHRHDRRGRARHAVHPPDRPTVTVFHQGRILVEDTFDNVVADPTVRDVYLGRRGVT